MKTLKIGEFSVCLTSKYGEYNCGNKTVGRLELRVTRAGSNTNEGASVINAELKLESVRDRIVNNFLADMTDRSTFGKLNGQTQGAEFFPSDAGTYPPGVLIYADSIVYNKGYEWYNNWKGLIALFESEPKFGVVVLKTPILPNKYYGPSRPSRVWTIVLPEISNHICYDKQSVSNDMKKSLKDLKDHYPLPANWKEELVSLGV